MPRFYKLLKDTPTLRANAVLGQLPDGRYVPTSDVYLQNDSPEAPTLAFVGFWIENLPEWYERVYQIKPDELKFANRFDAQKILEAADNGTLID